MLISLVWSYWPTLVDLCGAWRADDDYSVGQLVPLVAAYLLWSNRKKLANTPTYVCWHGGVLFVLAQLIRWVGLYYDYVSLERYSFLLSGLSAVLFLCGWGVVRQVHWIALFLALMVPLPGRVHTALTLPLQGFATRSAVFGLDLLGLWVVQRGNVIVLDESTQVAVAEACSGLRMLTAFVFVCATLAFIIPRSRWQRTIVVLSSLPIAVASNTIRLVVTVILFNLTSSDVAEKWFHDFAGVVMMPLAIVFVVGELWLLRRLTSGKGEKPSMPPPSSPETARPRGFARRPARMGN